MDTEKVIAMGMVIGYQAFKIAFLIYLLATHQYKNDEDFRRFVGEIVESFMIAASFVVISAFEWYAFGALTLVMAGASRLWVGYLASL